METITYYAGGKLVWRCKDCQKICREDEPLGGIMVKWDCEHCGAPQNRGDYVTVYERVSE